MNALNTEETVKYVNMSNTIAYTIHKASLEAVTEIKEVDHIDMSTSKAISDRIAPIVLAKMQEITKDLDREQLIKFFTQCMSDNAVTTMMLDSNYYKRIDKMAKE